MKTKSLKSSLYWADQIARRVIGERGKKKKYVCAAGITPSGTIHIGNFREIITVELVVRALRDLGKDVRFIYSWDDFDRLRKVPPNIPGAEGFVKDLLKPITKVPDPWKCHDSWARHFEAEVESVMPSLGVGPEFIRQSVEYGKCRYAKEIKKALENTKVIKKILDKYRKEQLPNDWMPIRVYCEKCGFESTRVMEWDREYTIMYACRCGHQASLDFRKRGVVKLPWRVDWPMRWHFERVDFEPAGKEHSTPGGSRTTGAEIQKAVWGTVPPTYQMYDYILFGSKGKMSSSKGNVLSIKEAAGIYMPEIMRYLFAGTKPIREFSIPLDEEVFKVYEDFYTTERIYFGKEKASPKTRAQETRIYQMSCPDRPPKTIPVQPNFRHAVTLVNIYREVGKALGAVKEREKITREHDVERYRAVLERAKFWLERYASDRWKFTLQEKVDSKVKEGLTLKQKQALGILAERLEAGKMGEDELFNLFYTICKEVGVDSKEFFSKAYLVLIKKEQGPRLAPFILAVGQDKIAKLLKQAA